MSAFHDLIAGNRMEEAIDYLRPLVKSSGNSNHIIQLTAIEQDHNKLKEDRILGIVTFQEEGIRRASIAVRLMKLYDDVNKGAASASTSVGTTDPASNDDGQDSKPKATISPGHNDGRQDTAPQVVVNINIYVSYSWKDDEYNDSLTEEENKNREKLEEEVNNLYDELKSKGYNLVRDKANLGYGQSIKKFMQELGESDLIIVFISDKYLRSSYSMFELYEIARNNKWDQELVRQKILPINLEEIRFKKPSIMTEYLNHWKGIEKEWEDLHTDNLQDAGLRENYQHVLNIRKNLTILLNWFADWNAMTVDLLKKDDFEMVKKAIDERVAEKK